MLQFKNSNEIFQFSAEILDKFISKLLRISPTGLESLRTSSRSSEPQTHYEVCGHLTKEENKNKLFLFFFFQIWDPSRTHYKLCFLSQSFSLSSVGAVDPLGTKSQLRSSLFAALASINCSSACSRIPRAKQNRVCKMTLLYGNCMACTNLHILLRTAEKHRLEHLAASAQAWGASPNLRYGELFDTHRIREKKRNQSPKEQENRKLTQHALSYTSTYCSLQYSFASLHYYLHLQPVFSLFPTYLHLCTETLFQRVQCTLQLY